MIRRLPYVALFILLSLPAMAQSTLPKEVRTKIAATLTNCAMEDVVGCYVKLDDLRIRESKGRTSVEVYASVELTYVPMRHEKVDSIYAAVRAALPAQYNTADLYIYADGELIDRLIPQYFDTQNNNQRFVYDSCAPLLRPISNLSQPSAGLKNRHIALWQSHGRYFNNRTEKWSWQRSCLWETVEDLYTQSYVIPYLVPMLERAGAVVLLPRERSMRREEIILDNDKATTYVEQSRRYEWSDAGYGFTHNYDSYSLGHNPFMDGTSRKVETVTDGKRTSTAVWSGNIPERGIYTLYVAYTSLPTSVSDAHYIVHSLGGNREFRINQRMGGGMWVALGEFEFEAGENQPLVSIVNDSMEEGVITADAIKIGGGMGNMSRGTGDKASTSGYPRFTEGARYWLQWAGFPEKVYNLRENADDYRDDYMSRAHWVNYVMGGSERAKDSVGLAVPLDMAFAFHSDAGIKEDSIVGTLGIFYTRENGGRYDGGASRYLARDLTDIVLTEICRDVRALHAPEWNRRGLWNRSYYEARVPSVPTMLLELLSHQNFNDMRYGLDPRFRFTVSRAIYKGILRYLSFQYDRPYVVQPLPVEAFAAQLTDEGVRLTWQPQIDSLEPTAKPDRYIVYTRVANGGFDNGRVVEGAECVLPLPADTIMSYRITAVNDGGESFPSETLSVCRVSDAKGIVLVVNGFDRVSAPVSYRDEGTAGFLNHIDGGVADRRDISFIGAQRGFLRSTTYDNNYEECLGSCYSDYAFEVLAGNTFDYAKLHGESIIKAGYSFCSASAAAVERGTVTLADYPTVDLILGKQLSTVMGEGASGVAFRTFTPAMQLAVRHFTSQGGRIFVSGSYVATYLWNGVGATSDGQKFAREVLHYRLQGGRATTRGAATVKRSQAKLSAATYRFNTELNDECYAVESPDAILPADKQSFVVMQYPDCGLSAAVGYKGDYRSLVVGFPFETITDTESRDRLMNEVLTFLNEK